MQVKVNGHNVAGSVGNGKNGLGKTTEEPWGGYGHGHGHKNGIKTTEKPWDGFLGSSRGPISWTVGPALYHTRVPYRTTHWKYPRRTTTPYSKPYHGYKPEVKLTTSRQHRTLQKTLCVSTSDKKTKCACQNQCMHGPSLLPQFWTIRQGAIPLSK